ncbi:FimV/HubP family polar landmark protein [Arenicella xantha]|uniref:FimV-like protein n=1 Tax=Arenicella xantha TaxID=644221 RepID=A0A395JMY0_9GAMM|nr:FimV/HubP family polar landmark protein [Arenicella xantha]RBP50978.1 FimV-like protein [Arenicella xantha]
MADRKMTFSKTKTANSILKQLGVTAAMLMASTNASALGLGALQVQSNLEEPLSGTIELRTAPSDDLTTLNARIASKEDFESLGIDYPTYMENISLSMEDVGGGKVLRVRSDEVVINEPFIHFLIRVDWSGGSFLREYTALIDPPVYAAATPKAVAEPRSVGTDQAYAQASSPTIAAETLDDDSAAEYDEVVVDDPPIEDIAEEDAPLIDDNFYEEPEAEGVQEYSESASSETVVPQGTDARYGPVTSGESLSLIAQELQRQFPDLSIYSIMQVLFEENKSAFIGNNINGLMEGSVLDIGDLNAIRAVDAVQAKAFFSSQVADWDPGVLISSSSDPISVGQDDYSFNDDTFGSSDTGSSSTGSSADNFQVGASRDTAEFVSSDQGASREGEVLALRQEISQIETALASSELENQELNERISSLEGQLADMNRLMSLDVESAEMAAVEQTLADQATSEPESEFSDTSATSTVDEFLTDTSVEDEFGLNDSTDSQSAVDEFLADVGTDDVDTSGESTVDEFLSSVDESVDQAVDATEDGFESVIEDASSGLDAQPSDEVDEAVSKVTPVIQPVKSESFMDKAKGLFFDGGLWKVLAGLVVLMLGGLGVLFARRRKVDEEFEISMLSIESNSQSVDTMQSDSSSVSASMSASVASVAEGVADKETSFLTVYSDSDAVVQADEVDPVAEADVYIAYGRDEQAEEVLLDGIANHPDRVDIKQKVLGLYQKTQNVEGFERVAEELYSQRDALTPELWEEVSAMGRELSPDNPLFSLSVDDLSTAASSSVSIDAAAESDVAASAASDEPSPLDGLEGHSELVEESLSDDDDIQLIDFDEGRSEVSELDDVEIDAISLEDDASDVLEFATPGLDDAALADSAGIDVSSDDDDGDLLSFEFDADGDASDDDEEQHISEVREVSDLEIDPDYDEARTQYELAKVFVDLGDEDGARKILSELVANDENDESVISDARQLLDSISG